MIANGPLGGRVNRYNNKPLHCAHWPYPCSLCPLLCDPCQFLLHSPALPKHRRRARPQSEILGHDRRKRGAIVALPARVRRGSDNAVEVRHLALVLVVVVGSDRGVGACDDEARFVGEGSAEDGEEDGAVKVGGLWFQVPGEPPRILFFVACVPATS